MMRRVLPLLALVAAPVAAQDAQNWTTLLLQGPVEGKLLGWAEFQTRFDQDISRFSVGIVRVGVGVRLKNDIDLMAGYQFQHNDLGNSTTDEHRAWQQVQAPLIRKPDGFALITRWRLEERSIVGADDLGWRLRAQFRVLQPLNGRGTGGPLLQSETFFALNSTDWGARAGFDQQRSFIGWLQPLSKRLNLEAGYMHVYLNRPGPNPGNHVLSITLNRRLG
jgi:Protein of unknown function (DUF2490)